MASASEPAGVNGGPSPKPTSPGGSDLFAPLPPRPNGGVSRLAGLLDADGSDPDSASSSRPSSADGDTTSPVTSPPYWLRAAGAPPLHHRSVSNISAESLPAGAITLRDNEADERNDDGGGRRGRSSACWARSVEVTDYVVVNGSATNIGAFVVWNVRVETLTVSAGFPHREEQTTDGVLGLVHEHPQALLGV